MDPNSLASSLNLPSHLQSDFPHLDPFHQWLLVMKYCTDLTELQSVMGSCIHTNSNPFTVLVDIHTTPISHQVQTTLTQERANIFLSYAITVWKRRQSIHDVTTPEQYRKRIHLHQWMQWVRKHVSKSKEHEHVFVDHWVNVGTVDGKRFSFVYKPDRGVVVCVRDLVLEVEHQMERRGEVMGVNPLEFVLKEKSMDGVCVFMEIADWMVHVAEIQLLTRSLVKKLKKM